MSKSFFWRGSRSRAIIAVLVNVVLAHTFVASPADGVVSVQYATTDRDFKNETGGDTSLRVRGWIDDVCLFHDLECLSQKSDLKGETTAQAKVIRELSRELNKTFAPKPNDLVAPNDHLGVQSDRVQWEVVLPATTTTPTSKRVDIAVEDRSQPNSFGIIEVKIWTEMAKVQPQILGYVNLASENGIAARPESRLNLPDPSQGRTTAWAKPYLYEGLIWCTWADPDADNLAGNVYFWPAGREEVPDPNYREHCLNVSEEKVRKRAEAEAAIDAMKRTREERRGAPEVMIFDAVGTTDQNGKATYAVAVLEQPTPSIFEMCYGDGICETRSVPPGSGPQIYELTHTFSTPSTSRFGPGVFEPVATISPENEVQKSFRALTTRDPESLSASLPAWLEDEGWDTAQTLVLVATFVAFLVIAAPFVALGLILWTAGGGTGGSRADGINGGVSTECDDGVHVLGVCIC